ncbi:MAG: phytoene desaturase, partial [Sphingobacteriales bacterium]
SPYKAPAMLSLIPHLEQNEGTFYPRGGMISITNALYRLAEKKAVTFHFNCPVTRIMYMDGKIKGVVVNDKNIHADVVVSNVDVFFTYKNLIGHIPKAKKVLKQERSSSALIFYWGIKGSFPELGLHNILFSADYKNEFEAIFKKRTITTDPTVYINITSKIEPALAPSGSENWFVMINVPANSGQDWEAIRQKARQEIIAKINNRFGVDLESMIRTETVLDPVLIEQQTSSFMGSLYGTSSNSKMAAFFRHPNFTNYIKGLYFCGGSVHPGGGIPLCLKSAKITGELISRDYKHKKRTSH